MDDNTLLLSGLHHFAYCPRRWALVHIEQLWGDNALTLDGNYRHEKVHDPQYKTSAKHKILSRAMPVLSERLGVRGECDMVELIPDPAGIAIQGHEGLYRVYPVEYKRGKEHFSDTWQLCAQAMCLEEMLCTDIPEGAIYSITDHRRTKVALDADLRKTVETALQQMRQYDARGYTPKVKARKACVNCSMRELCQVELFQKPSAKAYFDRIIGEDTP